jgi:hypothetical protein
MYMCLFKYIIQSLINKKALKINLWEYLRRLIAFPITSVALDPKLMDYISVL